MPVTAMKVSVICGNSGGTTEFFRPELYAQDVFY